MYLYVIHAEDFKLLAPKWPFRQDGHGRTKANSEQDMVSRPLLDYDDQVMDHELNQLFDQRNFMP